MYGTCTAKSLITPWLVVATKRRTTRTKSRGGTLGFWVCSGISVSDRGVRRGNPTRPMTDQFDPLEVAAVRRVLWALAGEDADDDGTLMDAAESAVDRVESLEKRVAELEELVDPDPGGKEYDALTKDQKVHRVRTALLEQANDSRNGKAKMNYKEVMWLFDGHPSPGHAYDLMERAGDLDGFAYDAAGGDGEKRVRVDVDGVNDDALVHAVNNDTAESPA